MDGKSGSDYRNWLNRLFRGSAGRTGRREDVVFCGLQEIENKSRLRLRKFSLKEANESGLEQRPAASPGRPGQRGIRGAGCRQGACAYLQQCTHAP